MITSSNKKNALLMMLIVLSINVFAVSNGAALFSLIEPSSRAGALGHAYVAQVDDGFATYWNTGAMAFNRKMQFAAMHTNWLEGIFEDIYLEYLSFNTFVQDVGNVGISITFMNYGEQDRVDEFGVGDGTFRSWDFLLAGNYGYQFSPTFGVGTTFKLIYSNLADEGQADTEAGQKGSSFSYAFDFGLLKKDMSFGIDGLEILERMDFGLNLQNVGPNMSYINEEQADPLAMNWRMGLSTRIWETEYNKVTINTDMNKELENEDFVLLRLITAWFDDEAKEEFESTIFNVGGEYTYYDLIAIRGGYIYDKAGDIIGPSFGFGVMYSIQDLYDIRFDFAAQQAGGLMDDFNKTYSLSFEF